MLPGDFALYALIYYVVQIPACLWLKNEAIIDVLILAVGFVLRVLAGAALLGVVATPWIVMMTLLVALFQGLAKRRDDLLRGVGIAHKHRVEGYNKAFIDVALSVVLGSLLVAYLIFTTDPAVMARYATDKLYYTALFVMAGILRYLQITLVEEKSGSPTEVILRDRFMLLALGGWALSFVLVTHVQ
jgi:4-hydroxybenzoate polyprenyltransferase